MSTQRINQISNEIIQSFIEDRFGEEYTLDDLSYEQLYDIITDMAVVMATEDM